MYVSESVVVVAGPLKGIEGEITTIDRRNNRCALKVTIDRDFYVFDLDFAVLAPKPKEPLTQA